MDDAIKRESPRKSIQLLQERYPHLDPALVADVVAELSPQIDQEWEAAESILKSYCEPNAVDYDSNWFNPSWSNNGSAATSSNAAGTETGSNAGTSESSITDIALGPSCASSSTGPMQADSANCQSDPGYCTAESMIGNVEFFVFDWESIVEHGNDPWDFLETDGRIALLIDTFPDQDPVKISEILESCDGQYQAAVDTLLNLNFLEEEKKTPIYKSIDGFAVVEPVKRKKGKRGGSHDWRSADDFRGEIAAASQSRPAWSPMGNAAKDLFTSDSPASKEFHLAGKVKHPTNDLSSRELASETTSAVNSSKPSRARNPIVPPGEFTAHIPKSSEEWTTVGPTKRRNRAVCISKTALPTDPVHLGTKHILARADATRYHIKSRSDHLMSSAAAVKREDAHNLTVQRLAMQARDADELAASQRLPHFDGGGHKLDLHYMTAADAVRIARAAVQDWWDRHEEEIALRGRVAEPFELVVGRGNNSDGKAVLGTRVFAALGKEGWKVLAVGGSVLVTGKRK